MMTLQDNSRDIKSSQPRCYHNKNNVDINHTNNITNKIIDVHNGNNNNNNNIRERVYQGGCGAAMLSAVLLGIIVILITITTLIS